MCKQIRDTSAGFLFFWGGGLEGWGFAHFHLLAAVLVMHDVAAA